tara:strand:- start:262 stop:864 length:603 start_codon:yes stop_codon:yes gene_type:complete
MKKFFKKFKFKWFSWEIDSVKLFPFLILFLAFLPILPHEKKGGKLFSVLGLEANVNNFYDLGIKSLEEGGTKEGDALYSLEKLSNLDFPFIKHREYLLEKGYEKDLMNCILLRDLFVYNLHYQSEQSYILNSYVPSPVPVVWFSRLLIKQFVDNIILSTFRMEELNSYLNKCSKYGEMFTPKGYLDGDFKHEDESNKIKN